MERVILGRAGVTMNDNMKQLRMREEGGKESGHEDGPALKTTFWSRFKDKLAKATAVTALSGLALVSARCSYDVPPLSSNDGGSDAGVIDAGPDSGPDMDGGHGGDGGMDAGPGDGGMDAGPSDGGMDAGVVCPSVTTGSFNGFISLATPATVGGYRFSYGGINGGGDALVSMDCGGSYFETNFPCPLNVDTTISRPADGAIPGRTIKIHPSTANASNTTLTINVTSP